MPTIGGTSHTLLKYFPYYQGSFAVFTGITLWDSDHIKLFPSYNNRI